MLWHSTCGIRDVHCTMQTVLIAMKAKRWITPARTDNRLCKYVHRVRRNEVLRFGFAQLYRHLAVIMAAAAAGIYVLANKYASIKPFSLGYVSLKIFARWKYIFISPDNFKSKAIANMRINPSCLLNFSIFFHLLFFAIWTHQALGRMIETWICCCSFKSI